MDEGADDGASESADAVVTRGGEAMPERALARLRALLHDLAAATGADLDVRLWDGSTVPLGGRREGNAAGATIAIRDPAAVARLARRPSTVTLFEVIATGLVEVEGASPLAAMRHLDQAEFARFAKRIGARGLVARLWPFLLLPAAPDSTLGYGGTAGAGEVRHHYDVSNAFYRLFLDERMVYSCAHFERPEMTLGDAQAAKIETCCRKLRLRPGARVLDIGCGWGALAIHAARHHGTRVVGITLSEPQLELARERVAGAGLSDRIELRLADWRDVADGPFDAVVQVGMYEHVAPGDQADFLAAVHRLLADDGVYLHHAITGDARRVTTARPGPYKKVIDRYIFPGGHLDHIGRTLESLERARFEVHDVEGWRRHYARTCAEWSERLWAQREAAEREVGADVTRTWLLYLAMVSTGFERGLLNLYQTVATKRRRGDPPVPPSRRDLYERPTLEHPE